MSQDAQATILKQNNCANIDGIQLVLFMDLGGTLQHSMLIIQRNIWIGANNLFSLGAGDEKIQVYYDMSNRTHVDGKRGGWNRVLKNFAFYMTTRNVFFSFHSYIS